jgi:general stress protein CsbA
MKKWQVIGLAGISLATFIIRLNFSNTDLGIWLDLVSLATGFMAINYGLKKATERIGQRQK